MRARTVLLVALLLASQAVGQTITVDPNTSFQTMKGWEYHAQSGEIDFPSNFAVYGSTLLDAAVESGLNRVRVELHAGWEHTSAGENTSAINDNADPNTINAAGFQWGNLDTRITSVIVPLRSRLAAQGESLYVNLCYVDFLSGGSFFHCNDSAEYAEFLWAAFDHINSGWGFVPDAVEVILEPNSGNNAARWTATKLASCLIAAQSRLAASGWTPRFIVPGSVSCPDADTWYNDVKTADANTTQYIDELSYHLYTDCDATTLAQNRDAAQTDGNRISMLEFWNSTNNYTKLHRDIGPDGNAVSWQAAVITYPNIADDHGIAGVYFLTETAGNTVTIARRTKFYRQYFKFIRMGAVRKGTSTGDSNFDGLAFRNPNGLYVVVVKCATSGSFTIGGLPAGTYGIKWTTDASYNQDNANQTIGTGQNISTSINAAGVLTVYGISLAARSGMTRGSLSGKAAIR